MADLVPLPFYAYIDLISRAGGMTAAFLTLPLDVVRTRLQSDFYRPQLATDKSDLCRLPSPDSTNAPCTVFHEAQKPYWFKETLISPRPVKPVSCPRTCSHALTRPHSCSRTGRAVTLRGSLVKINDNTRLSDSDPDPSSDDDGCFAKDKQDPSKPEEEYLIERVR
jgi:hypothetical protein